jgi:GNAT superfamily N-acetyltransferase
MTEEPRLARRSELDKVAELFASAFKDDPIIRWPFPDDAPPDADVELFTTLVRDAYGPLDVTWVLGAPDAAAVWLPPAEAARFLEIERPSRARITPLTDDRGRRYDAFWEWMGAHVPDEPCWFLEIVAVDKGRRGAGLASTLIRHGLARAAAAGQPAFLETSIPRNVAVYEHLGFRVAERGEAPNGGPTIWFMRAEPPS